MILGNWNFYVFLFVFFGKWANVIWVMNMKPLILLSQGRSVPLFLFHPQSVFLSCIYSFLPLWQCVCPQTLWRKQPLSILRFFLICFISSISVYMAGDKMAAISFDRLHRFTLLPPLFGFSLSPFQAYSSQYLPVLSKCYCKVFQWDDSKYVYINRGNTLGYILLNPCVVWSLHRLLVSRSNLNLSDDVCRAFAWESSFKFSSASN